MGKEQDVLDVRGVRNKHGQPVYSDSASPGGRHAVLHCPEEVLVHGVGFPIALALHFNLLLEPPALVHRVVQLGECVGELTPADKQFESFSEFRIVRMPLGQRRNLDGIIRNEGRILQTVLHEVFEEPVDHLAPAQFGVHIEAPVTAYRRELRGRHPGDVDIAILANGV